MGNCKLILFSIFCYLGLTLLVLSTCIHLLHRVSPVTLVLMSKPDTMFSDTSVLWNMFSADILDTCPSISRTLMTSDDCFFLWHQHHHYLLVCWISVCLIQYPGLCLPRPVLVSDTLALSCTFDSILWMSSIMSDSMSWANSPYIAWYLSATPLQTLWKSFSPLSIPSTDSTLTYSIKLICLLLTTFVILIHSCNVWNSICPSNVEHTTIIQFWFNITLKTFWSTQIPSSKICIPKFLQNPTVISISNWTSPSTLSQ